MVLERGHHYECLRISSSGFNVDFLKKNIEDYHDKQLMDYIRFGYPLNISAKAKIENNAATNHASARYFPEFVATYINTELDAGALIGPLDHPHIRTLRGLPLCPSQKNRAIELF